MVPGEWFQWSGISAVVSVAGFYLQRPGFGDAVSVDLFSPNGFNDVVSAGLFQ